MFDLQTRVLKACKAHVATCKISMNNHINYFLFVFFTLSSLLDFWLLDTWSKLHRVQKQNWVSKYITLWLHINLIRFRGIINILSSCSYRSRHPGSIQAMRESYENHKNSHLLFRTRSKYCLNCYTSYEWTPFKLWSKLLYGVSITIINSSFHLHLALARTRVCLISEWAFKNIQRYDERRWKIHVVKNCIFKLKNIEKVGQAIAIKK